MPADTHAYVPHPWGKPICDAKIDDGSGRARTCCEPPEAEVHQVSSSDSVQSKPKGRKAMKQIRQGDVFVEKCAKPRAVLKEIEPDKDRVILAHGEVTGHAHALSSKHAKLYEVKGWVERLLVVTKATALMHEEHGRIELPPGSYKVRIQKEYHPEEIRNVAD